MDNRKPAVAAFALLFLPLCFAQHTIIQLQIRLNFDDGTAINTVEGVAGVSASQRTGGGGTMTQASSIAIRVQLQDGFGAVVAERTPDRNGVATFGVQAVVTNARAAEMAVSYRIRVYGPEIDEVIIENVDPVHGERMVNISLHKKSTGRSPGGMVSATQFNIPEKARNELEKGNLDLGQHNLESAERHFRKAIEIYPTYDWAWNNLGVIQMQRGDVTAGRQAFEKAIAVNPHFPRALTNLGKLALVEKKYNEADALLRRALQADPHNTEALMLAAEAALFTGKLDEAIADVRLLHTLAHERFGLGHFFAGRALESQGKTSDAAREYELFLAEAPQSPNAPFARAALERIKQ